MAKIDEILSSYKTGYDLPGAVYTDSEVFEKDIESVYTKNWIFAGHINELPNAGDFFLFRIARESIIVVKDYDGNVNAFLNVCRHRGSPLCFNDAGNIKQFICPYHAWVYNLSGKLIAASRMPKQFDYTQHALFQCSVKVIQGLIFICLASVPPDFEVIEKHLTNFLKPHGLEQGKICHTMTQHIQANWKIVAENAWECYHCPASHSLFSSAMPYTRVTDSANSRAKQEEFQRKWENQMHQIGHHYGKVELKNDGIIWCQRNPLKPGFVTQSRDGQPVAPLMGEYQEYDCGITAIEIFPVCWFSACNDYVLLSRYSPLSTTLTEAKFYWLVAPESKEGRDYITDDLIEFWRTTAEEDKVLCEANQNGVSSSRYVPGMLSETEAELHRFIEWYFSQVREKK